MNHGTLEEKRKLTTTAWIFLTFSIGMPLGFLFCLFPLFFASTGDEAHLFFVLAYLTVFTIPVCSCAGCAALACSRGHTAAYGFLGLLWIIGLFVVLALPDRWQAPPPASP